MSFREKSAWVCFIGLLGVYGTYFVQNGFQLPDTATRAGLAYSQFWLMISLVVIMVAGHIVAAVLSPKDAEADCDERDSQIIAKSGALGGNIAMAGALLAAASAFKGATGFQVANWVLLAVFAGELVRYGMQIAKYRYWL
ncbi:hypothetical protein [Hirschia baltica]|uniref:Uncharacterized protein n=1 Tax=Hirschia baltica (strain ATCC 49814 / DSM 5838 / IFAM 1418) TaxID=582402 RepID=C6XNB7_HIRBI|nr:hypothetical protein [Hirschia baltica]ACT60061.1 hypothetical protein Hbal_2381 [Hirschia baltica ATCC 49814]